MARYYLAGSPHFLIIWLPGAQPRTTLMHTLNSRKLQLGMVVEKDFRMKHAEALNWAREARRHKIMATPSRYSHKDTFGGLGYLWKFIKNGIPLDCDTGTYEYIEHMNRCYRT